MKNLRLFLFTLRQRIAKLRFLSWLSIPLPGIVNIIYGQYIKGLLFFLAEFWFWIICFPTFGLAQLRQLASLGETPRRAVLQPDGTAILQGDNSLQILLFSIFIIAMAVAAILIWVAAVKSARLAEKELQVGRRPTSFWQDLKNLFDKNLHITMLSLPTIGVIAFTVLPIIFMICLAFTNFNGTNLPPTKLFSWTGLDTFRQVFGSSAGMNEHEAVVAAKKAYTFGSLIGWTLIWAVFATFLNYIFGMLISLMINKKGIKLKGVFRACFVLAIAVPAFVTLQFMRQLLMEKGVINTLLLNWGIIKESIRFLDNTLLARITVIVVNLWIGIPYTILITSGILMNIPADLYEAASIDGAGPFKKFTNITLPYMLAVTTPYLITQFIGNINNFNAIYLLTQGYPLTQKLYEAGQTDLLVTWLYKLSITSQYKDFNIASVIGICTFVICATLSLVTYNITSSKKKEATFR
ncbi:MAG: sugar ABC transporter permease [Clostridiales bacterium]|nr:sugar ABC transporter permease [Clostridiales bacterium]